MTTAIEIHGHCDERYSAVREAFSQNFASGLEVGASVAITIDGQSVVDLWGGRSDAAATRPWERDTIARVYSATKGVTATCLHILADRGLVDFDAPVAQYWPEFAQAGKERIIVSQLLDHSAGLAAVIRPLTSEDQYNWDTMIHALEQQAPWWEPGTAQGYHAIMFGWLVGEMIRRVGGKTPGAFIRDELAGPLGIDFYLGFGPELDSRVADMLPPPGRPDAFVGDNSKADDPASLVWNVWRNPARYYAEANTRAARAAEIPAGNMHTNARAFARFYGALACGGEIDGTRLLSPAGIARASAERRMDEDLVSGVITRRSLGFALPIAGSPEDPRSSTAFGHRGAGGSYGFADPSYRLGFGYVMNQAMDLGDPRANNLVAAAYACV